MTDPSAAASLHADPGLGPGLALPSALPAAPAASAAPGGRSTAFVPVEGPVETTSAAGMLVAAYLVMWALVLAFVALSFARTRRLGDRIAVLEAAIRKAEARARFDGAP